MCCYYLWSGIIYVHIWFELQGIIQKQTKYEKIWASVCKHTSKRTKVLCRVQAHGKAGTCRQPMHLGWPGMTKRSLCRALTHSKDGWHGKWRITTKNGSHDGRWSTRGLAVKARHMVEKVHTVDHLLCLHRAHGSQGPHPGARQRTKHLYCVVWSRRHTTDPLSCLVGVDTRQIPSAVVINVVTSLSCVCTWQRVCRVRKQLCRVFGPHGRPWVSGSEVDTMPATQRDQHWYVKQHGVFLLVHDAPTTKLWWIREFRFITENSGELVNLCTTVVDCGLGRNQLLSTPNTNWYQRKKGQRGDPQGG
jgi:hypothetical protein